MKIAIVVHGRFHAFDLARALIERGNDVTVFTNYPRWAVARFGIPVDRVCSFPLHGVLARVANLVCQRTGASLESLTHPLFARWAIKQIRRSSWDVIHAFTGVSEEIYKDPHIHAACKLIMRGSAHIRVQATILQEEEARVGVRIDRPSDWMIHRELREYELCDRIVTLSTFAYNTFRQEGFPASKLCLLPLGAEMSAFRPDSGIVEARRERILSGAPIRVLYVGNISFQKGLAEMRDIVVAASSRFQFRFVGEVTPEARPVVAPLRALAVFVGKVGHYELPAQYHEADIFMFPSVQDGFAAVLAQASAAALPILTTTNCAGPDIIREGRTGWVLPIRNPQAFLERLIWCDSHRVELADIVATAYSEFRGRDWTDVAADFESLCAGAIVGKQTPLAEPVVLKQ